MIRHALRLAAAIAAVAAAAAVCVVAASFAVYAVARTWLTEAGAAAVVVAVFALLALVVAWLVTRKVVPRTPRRGAGADEGSTTDRILSLAKERPLVALAAAGAAAAATVTVLLRNPAIIGAIVSAFVAGSATKSRK